MTLSERVLQALLRVVGAVSLCALSFVVVPQSWMDAIHRELGLGVLPDKPIVGYLARSTSAFYALLGGLLWAIASDLRRYRPVVQYTGAALIVLGILLFGVDRACGLPDWWWRWEGPLDASVGAAILGLGSRVPALGRAPKQTETDP